MATRGRTAASELLKLEFNPNPGLVLQCLTETCDLLETTAATCEGLCACCTVELGETYLLSHFRLSLLHWPWTHCTALLPLDGVKSSAQL